MRDVYSKKKNILIIPGPSLFLSRTWGLRGGGGGGGFLTWPLGVYGGPKKQAMLVVLINILSSDIFVDEVLFVNIIKHFPSSNIQERFITN